MGMPPPLVSRWHHLVNMINLIPPEARSKVKREYWVRVVSTWMLLISVVFLVVTLLKIPVYVLVNDQLEAFADSIAAAETNEQHFNEAAAKIESANAISGLLVQEDRVQFSDVIADISNTATVGIQIENYNLTRTEDNTLLIVVAGEASTRQELATFKVNLEAHARFDTVELPISNLAKDVDIPFQITIIPTVIESDV